MKLNFNEFLAALHDIDDPNSMQWDGDLFLPPSDCFSPLPASTKKHHSALMLLHLMCLTTNQQIHTMK